MKSVLRTLDLSNKNILDMGTGPYALLSVYLKNRFQIQSVTAADYLDSIIFNAALQPGAKGIEFIKTNLFDNLDAKFDIILFNAPYISDRAGSQLGIYDTELSRERWSGGEDGVKTISRFLSELHNFLTTDGVCLLGINHFYLKDQSLRKELKKFPQLNLFSYSKNRVTHSGVYILRRSDL
ncbi:MAG: hypothetical protein SCALA702_04460 [Melioribacteraceae bacterium]|nr:MAG: hypothetical protein SCALA702_04460 [Melioribacteraceae bacterium]